MKPNIVLITADQWRGDCLGCSNSQHPVMTPHLNQIAAEGAYFGQAYADCPVCMPQRVTTLTGYSASHFELPHNYHQRSPIDRETSLPTRLSREAGYQTKAIGKMHVLPDRARFGFEHITLHPNDYAIWLENTPYAGSYRGHGLGGNEVYPAVASTPEQYTHTHWIIDNAVRFVEERDPDCPFFLWLVFEAPHSPYDPPPPYDRMYDNFTIPEPAMGDWTEGESCPTEFTQRRLQYKYDQLNDEMVLESRRRYYGQISHIDYQLGRFFGELKTKGLYDNTAIIFTSDHGDHLGDHGVWSKTTYLNGSARVPLVMRVPQSVPITHPALNIHAPVLTADLHPTILNLAGLQADPESDGISLLPVLAGDELLTDRIICGEYGQGGNTTFATDGHYKFIYYAQGAVEQLFDVINDPDDLHNLIEQLEMADMIIKLKHTLLDYLTGFDSPLVQDGAFIRRDTDFDAYEVRGRNPAAWRGPMRYGQGYYG